MDLRRESVSQPYVLSHAVQGSQHVGPVRSSSVQGSFAPENADGLMLTWVKP
jgi:hypothetical protein